MAKLLKNLNFHHLLYFRAVAKFASFSRAAQELNLGQPALSMQVKALEESLGVKLLERKKTGLELTEEGEQVLKFAERIHGSGHDLLDSLKGRVLPEDPFRLGTMESVPKSLVSWLCAELLKTEGARLKVKERDYLGLIRELQTRHINAAICEEPPFRDSALRAKHFASYTVSLCGAQQFAGLSQDFPKSLDGAPIIMPSSGTKLRSQLEHYFELHKVRPRYVIETFDTALQKLLAKRGLGLVPLSQPSMEEFLAFENTLEIATLKGVYKELWILYRPSGIANPQLDKLLSLGQSVEAKTRTESEELSVSSS